MALGPLDRDPGLVVPGRAGVPGCPGPAQVAFVGLGPGAHPARIPGGHPRTPAATSLTGCARSNWSARPPLEETVRGVWDRLAVAGLPSLARNAHPSNRPHLTLASVDEFPPGAEQRLADLCAAALPLPARLQRVEVLDGSAPLVWLVRPVPEAGRPARRGLGRPRGRDGQNPWHLPGRWIRT